MGAFCGSVDSLSMDTALDQFQAALARLEGKTWTIEFDEACPPYHLSKKGLNFIIRHETYGRKPALKMYLDSAGNPTIGYGHKVEPGEHFSNGATMAQALDLLKEDVQQAVDEVNASLNVPLAQNQFDALVDLAYNEGPRSVQQGHEMMLALNAGGVTEFNFTQYDLIKVHGRYVKGPGLFMRRVEEWLLFEKGDY